MSAPGELLLRADASASIGTGHVMRSLALAQAWAKAGGKATFALQSCPHGLCERLRAEGFDLATISAERASPEDARETARLAAELGARRVALDGYAFHAGYQATLRAQGLCTLVVDDEARAEHFVADFVLNQNAYATPELYKRKADGARLVVGARFALLRSEFEPWRLWRREIPERARRILVTTGGSDPDNAALRVLRGLARVADASLEIQVVVGAGSPHLEVLEREAALRGARVVCGTRNMPELMAWADLAITAAGSTCWELAFMGTPALALVIADNQERIAACLEERGVARSLGRAELLEDGAFADALARSIGDQMLRTTQSHAGRRLIDGRGAARVASLFLEAA